MAKSQNQLAAMHLTPAVSINLQAKVGMELTLIGNKLAKPLPCWEQQMYRQNWLAANEAIMGDTYEQLAKITFEKFAVPCVIRWVGDSLIFSGSQVMRYFYVQRSFY